MSTRSRRVPRTFEAAFSQSRSQGNQQTVNYQQALISSHHAQIALLPPPTTTTTNTTNNNNNNNNNNTTHSLDQIILGEQLDLPLHDPASHFLTSLVHSDHPAHPPSDLIFDTPEQPQQSYSPDPPPSNDDARLSCPDDDLYGSSPPNADPQSPPPSSPPPQPPTKPAPPPKIVLALPRPAPLKLCLPSHAPREVIQHSPHPPCNSPAVTPGATSAVPPGGSSSSTSGLRTAGGGKQALSRPAKRIPSSSSSSSAAAVAKKQKHNPLFLASASAKHKLISEADRLRVLKRIQVLKGPRNASSSSCTHPEPQTGPNTPLARATQLATDAQAYLDAIQKVQDALGEELVRVQLEESVLRHVRGIIADRLVKNHDWNHHYHHT
ncbi:hypothetical protein PCANC_27285 [Puccinia coronata f. sp. avenae]|uniref:Uncharacterized protein n=1 Tax=Puccinia coronata f. sp. avenae TaxID=200324 RepID=A0A2N5V1K0_9BASI|nr:hypothetical protein PCANC_27285 [Puccinia coronata f. sp. avenae]PLW43878.1 hypothetical protein PCASD_05783 [Puccinia coronata f. sp. avenae]